MTKKPLLWYRKKLDAVFSKYIRGRDGYQCYTCLKWLEPKASQCGHFVPRQYLSTRYEEKNAHCQCYACNVLYNGQPSAYAERLRKDYGEKIIGELEERRRQVVKLTPAWYEAEIQYYSERIKEL